MMKPPTDHETADETAKKADVPPRAPGEIPGLGPIRVRALAKAGYADLLTLREATIEELTAVPGMSEIKARHIQSFLSQFTTAELQPVVIAAEDSPPHPFPETTRDAEVSPVPWQHGTGLSLRVSGLPQIPTDVQREGESVVNLAMALLLTEAAPAYRARLLREVIGFIQLVRMLLQCTLSDARSQDRALRRLQAAGVSLGSALATGDLDRKAQTRLADELAQAGNRLETLIGRTLTRHAAETVDE